MSAPSNLWDHEKNFWTGGADFYAVQMSPDAVMVFGPAGILRGEAIIEALEGAPRWSSVDFDETTGATHGDTAVIAYKATGRREGKNTYVAYCASTYVLQNGVWILVAHQQTAV